MRQAVQIRQRPLEPNQHVRKRDDWSYRGHIEAIEPDGDGGLIVKVREPVSGHIWKAKPSELERIGTD